MKERKVTATNPLPKARYIKQEGAATPTHDQLKRDCGYFQSQKLLRSMLDCGLISLSEFNKITLLNRQSFYPYLVEIMPEIR